MTPPPEPVLQDFKNIQCRDAVLAWDREELVRDAKGKPLRMTMLAAEKVFQSYRLEVTNPGGHSAQPQKDNAIYRLSSGLAKER